MNDMLIESAPASGAPWPAVAQQAFAGAATQHPQLAHELQAALWQVLTETLARVGARPAGPAPAAPATPAHAATAAPGQGRLSAREREVLLRIAAGDSNKAIARAFALSPHTVKRHVANILVKLGASSRGQAAAWWRAQH